MTITVRINQTHDTQGNPAQAEYLQPIYPPGVKSAAATIWEFIEPMQPLPTQDFQSGIYWYQDPARGSGWLRVENAGMFTEDRLNQMVRLSQIERAIGQKNPVRGAEPGAASAFVMTMSNPYGQLILGAIFLILLLIFGTKIAGMDAPTPFLIVMAVFGLIVLAVSIYMFVTGFRRLPWWRKARAYALADGGPMPDDLKVFW